MEKLHDLSDAAGLPREVLEVQEEVEDLPHRDLRTVLAQTLRYGGEEAADYDPAAAAAAIAEFKQDWDAGQEAREHKIMTADYPMKVVLDDLTQALNARDFGSGAERQEFAAAAVEHCLDPLLQPDTPEQQEQLREVMTQFLGSYPGVTDRNHDHIFLSEKMQEALYPRPEKDPTVLDGLPPLSEYFDPDNPKALFNESLRRVRAQRELERDPVKDFIGVVAMATRRAGPEELAHFNKERYSHPEQNPVAQELLTGLYSALFERYPGNAGHADWDARHWSNHFVHDAGLGDLSKVFDNQAFYSKEHRRQEAKALTDAVLGPAPDPAASHPLDRLPHALLLASLNHAGRAAGEEHFSGGVGAITGALDWSREKLYGKTPYEFLHDRIQQRKDQAEAERAKHSAEYPTVQYGGNDDPAVYHPRQLGYGMNPEVRIVLGVAAENFSRTFAAAGLEPSGSLNFPGVGHEQFQPSWIEVNPGEKYACTPEELDRRQLAAALADAAASRALRQLLKGDELPYEREAASADMLDRRAAAALQAEGPEATAFTTALRGRIAAAGLDEKADPAASADVHGLYEKTCDVLYDQWERVKKERDRLYRECTWHPDPAARVLAREVLNGGNLVYAPKPGDYLTYVHSPPHSREPTLYPLLKTAAMHWGEDPRQRDPESAASPEWRRACDHYGPEPLTNGQVARYLARRDQDMDQINRNMGWAEPPWADQLYKAGARIDAARLLLDQG